MGDTAALLNVLHSDTHNVYIEWCQPDSGSYLYFDLATVVQTLKIAESLDISVLCISKSKNTDNKVDSACYFDESVPISSRLRSSDILVLSPMRSVLRRYTPMGLYSGHQL